MHGPLNVILRFDVILAATFWLSASHHAVKECKQVQFYDRMCTVIQVWSVAYSVVILHFFYILLQPDDGLLKAETYSSCFFYQNIGCVWWMYLLVCDILTQWDESHKGDFCPILNGLLTFIYNIKCSWILCQSSCCLVSSEGLMVYYK